MSTRIPDPDQPIYVISIAAELAGVHPQTLRVYERKGLLSPQRTSGNSRRYSARDIELLQRIQDLTNEGINLTGVMRILELEQELGRVDRQRARLSERLRLLEDQLHQAMSARDSSSLVPFKDVRRIRRAMKSDFVEQMGQPRRFPSPPVSD